MRRLTQILGHPVLPFLLLCVILLAMIWPFASPAIEDATGLFKYLFGLWFLIVASLFCISRSGTESDAPDEAAKKGLPPGGPDV